VQRSLWHREGKGSVRETAPLDSDEMALGHLRDSVTKQNLWLYVLRVLKNGPSSPSQIIEEVLRQYGFRSAAITFYTVLYRLTREGLVAKTSAEFRSRYRITEQGRVVLAEGLKLLTETARMLGEQSD
jgi:PadR family transcriptional regulator PadR